MRAVLLISALLTAPALADTRAAVTAALDRFTTVCPQALADPEGYIETLSLPGPAGEDAIYRSDDGQYLLVHTAQVEGITDYVEFSTVGGRALRTCAIRATIPDFPEAPDIADLLYPMLKIGAKEVIGGQVPLVTPMWDPGETAEAFESGDWYVFHMTGLWPDSDVIATAQVELGAVSFYVSHTEAAQ